MSANDNLLEVLVLLLERGAISGKELETKVSVDRRTIRNYMSALKNAGFPVVSSKGRSSLYQLQGEHPLSGLKFSYEEIEALNAALNHLRLEKGFLYEETYINVLQRIKTKARIVQDPPSVPTANKTVGDPERVRNQQWVHIIRAAIHEKRKLQMVYHSAGRDVVTERIVWPFGLYNVNDENYLLAHCENSNDTREFKVKRVKELNILKEYFPRSSQLSVKEYFKDSIGAFGGKPFKVRLAIRPPFSLSMQEKSLVKNQKIETFPDGSIHWEARVSGRPDVIRWILGMGEHCTVLEPGDLVDEVKLSLKKALSVYG